MSMRFKEWLNETTFQDEYSRIVYGPASADDIEYIEEDLSQPLPRPVICIEDFYVPPEHRHAVATFRTFAKFLKQHPSKTIICQAYPYEKAGTSEFSPLQTTLVKWYERFGFISVGQGWMYRLPLR